MNNETQKTKIEFTRVNDVNGHPRYVCHFTELLTLKELEKWGQSSILIKDLYKIAENRAKKIGGKKYNSKKYLGGILFQSYNIESTERSIKIILQNEQ